jgi:hypothetical protein
MPTYSFEDLETGKTESIFMSISEMEEYLVKNPSKRKLLSTPAIVSGVSGIRKPDEGFRDILRSIKKNNRGSKLNIA